MAEEEEEERWRQEILEEASRVPRRQAARAGDDDSLISGAMVGGVLLASTDVERLIAELAFRYTAELPLTAMSKADQAAHTTLMTAVLACFEALVAAHRTAELSNTIGAEPQAIDPWPHSPAQLVFSRVRKRSAISLETQWVLLGAAEDGGSTHAWLRRSSVLRSNRLAPVLAGPPSLTNELDERTQRCLRFLTSLTVGRDAISDDSRRAVVGNVCEAARINLQQAWHRPGGDQIAQWLGVSHILC